MSITTDSENGILRVQNFFSNVIENAAGLTERQRVGTAKLVMEHVEERLRPALRALKACGIDHDGVCAWIGGVIDSETPDNV